MFSIKAPAKINLALEVLGKRPDGYHNIKSVVQTIDLADELEFSQADTLDIRADKPDWDAGKSLVSRAALMLQSRYEVSTGARIRVAKRVPLAAGLGGDSSCAAAALKGLNRLWQLGLGSGQLMEMAAELGSDVPFLFCGGTALIEGRGEIVSPLRAFPAHWAVVVVPQAESEVDNKTGRLYGMLKREDFSDGSRTEEFAEALIEGRNMFDRFYGNTFEKVAFANWPGLEALKKRLLDAGARRVHLSGAGPALFSLHRGKLEAERVYKRQEKERAKVFLVGVNS